MKLKTALLFLLLASCAKSVPVNYAPATKINHMANENYQSIERRYLACTAGLGDAFFEAFPRRYRHEAHRIAAECLEWQEGY